MKDILPVFYDHSSYKSILTWWGKDDVKSNGPQSILSMTQETKLEKVVFVSKNFATFLEAWKACKAAAIQLVFGVEFILCDDSLVHNKESQQNEHKVIIFIKNSQGYSDLLKIYSACHTNPENKYYIQRFDLKQISALWTKNLHLVFPFFDSFIANNTVVFGANIMPDLSFCGKDKTIFREVNAEHPHEELINESIDKYVDNTVIFQQKVKTIYYKSRSDFRAYMTYRAIQNRKTFKMPNIDYFCSDSFCFENWKELIA